MWNLVTKISCRGSRFFLRLLVFHQDFHSNCLYFQFQWLHLWKITLWRNCVSISSKLSIRPFPLRLIMALDMSCNVLWWVILFLTHGHFFLRAHIFQILSLENSGKNSWNQDVSSFFWSSMKMKCFLWTELKLKIYFLDLQTILIIWKNNLNLLLPQ